MLKTNKRKTLIIAFVVTYVFSVIVYAGSVKGDGTVIALNPSSYTAQKIGEEFTINITIANVQDLWSWKVRITWERSVLSLVSGPSEGPFLKSIGATLFLSTPPKNGSINEIDCTLMSDTGANGSGTLATMVFRINNEAFLSPITLDNEVLLAPLTGGTHPNINHQVQSATVTLGTQGGIRADAGGNQSVNEGTPVTFNASRTLSQEPEQNLTFTWTFTDRGPVKLTGMVVTYTFTIPGVYSVNLTVSDPEGRTSTDSIKIKVRDITPPVAVITLEGLSPNQQIEVGQPILFSGTRSYDPKNGTIISYTWNLGNGITRFVSSFSYAYSHPGTYNVSLTVTEVWGLNNTAVVTITVVKANHPLSLFSDTGGILIAVTAMVLIALPFWIDRALHRKAMNVAK
jgi:hypothetical protein